MAMSHSPSPHQNRLLSAMAGDIQKRIFPYIELTPLSCGKVLYEAGDTMRDVYFPTDATVALLHKMESGASAGILMVGNEGLVGAGQVMGENTAYCRAVVLSAGNAYRLSGQCLKEEFNRHGDLLMLVLLYTQTLITQMGQVAVCNRHHTIEQRFCRWLLMALDRQQGNLLTATHQLIADTLGVRRESVSDAAGKLQKRGAITYGRGHINVLSRSKLEHLSCECYAVVKNETDRLLRSAPEKVFDPCREVNSDRGIGVTPIYQNARMA